MKSVMKQIIFSSMLLLIIPSSAWIFGWQWQLTHADSNLLKGLFGVTQTASYSWGILTCILLSACFLRCLRFRLKVALQFLVLLLILMVIGQTVKIIMKNQIKEPRPFLVCLETKHHIENKNFYSLNIEPRTLLLKRLLKSETNAPTWLKKYWQAETGFSFPSGHSIFAASWALLAVGLLWPLRYYKTVIFLMLWSSGVMISRLLLGMHWPIDIFVSILISSLLSILSCWVVYRWIDPIPLNKKEKF
ncbi:phosphatidylglycerophosphatase B [Candidatus Hamiltonella defensa]|uniref:undecaprenyl-diphosphate phosphatase n=1 Tax=Candidatus Williamhamiltonella defendens TaxID=138072 RepID=A0A2D3TBV9_9ENTR|nr:phosphatidylglycerophosphatase B [Candidatus Hamiltonella defensa]ASV32871.1 phosphatidylglycerophosphatase B [Candidatus Hamiltonella defensa]ATW33011.1 phosphatidylglycerophosphatase B [Candidatus Hamiltonella defensa]MBK4361083.1 phosphatidylglycerophosphatase B [Candidatus Hamiltonella defensa]